MRGAIFILSISLASKIAHAQVPTVQHYLAYGDPQTVALARSTGTDPLAEIGKEIPRDRNFRIPTSGTAFTVQNCVRLISGPVGAIFPDTYVTQLCYDRTFGSSNSRNPPLVSESFRKLAPAFSNVRANFGNFPSYPGYDWDGTILDFDGVPGLDTAIMQLNGSQEPFTSCIFGSGQSLRPVGLRGILYGGTPQGIAASWRMRVGDSFRVCDITLRSGMTAGEVYGNREGETGLMIYTNDTAQEDGAAFMNTVFNDPRGLGAKYVVQAVPEPGSLAVLSLGAAWLLKRRLSNSNA